MKIIVGLGNPDEKYKGTRHNAGFAFLEKLACEKELSSDHECLKFSKNEKFEAEIAETIINGEKLILVKPQTYMNLSGRSVEKVMSYYNADIADLIVVADDVDLPLGTVRIRHEGSSGGQKGLQNIIDLVDSDKFLRIRLGIRFIDGYTSETEDSNQFDTTNFVLGKFNKRELSIFDETVADTIKYVLPFIGSKSEIPAHTLQVKQDSL